jgi:hypothetical protein
MCKKHEKVDHNIMGVKGTLHDQNGGHVKTSVRDCELFLKIDVLEQRRIIRSTCTISK